MCNQCKIFTEKGKYYCPESMDHFKYCPFCGEELKFEEETPKIYKDIWEYIGSLPVGSDKWRNAYDISFEEYHNKGKNPSDYLEEIIKKVEEK
jgi:hypothetical protein